MRGQKGRFVNQMHIPSNGTEGVAVAPQENNNVHHETTLQTSIESSQTESMAMQHMEPGDKHGNTLALQLSDADLAALNSDWEAELLAVCPELVLDGSFSGD